MKNNQENRCRNQTKNERPVADGFTLIEVNVALVVSAIFIAMFISGYQFMVGQANYRMKDSAAQAMARTNLGKYDNQSKLRGYNCNSNTNINNAYVLLNDSSSDKEPQPEGFNTKFNQRVVVYAQSGCDKMPVVESSVSYSHNGDLETVKEAKYAN